MRNVTGKEIEKRAIMQLVAYSEFQIDTIIRQSLIELDKLNELKRIQGLNTKTRIDEYCIKNAIKTINSNGHSSSPERAGGITPKETEREKHPKENTEVA